MATSVMVNTGGTKQYFAKYLPYEPKENDSIDIEQMVIHKVGGKWTEPVCWDDMMGSQIEDTKFVKLYLCTRGVSVGDKDVYLELCTQELELVKEVKDQHQLDLMVGIAMVNRGMFKVIGEISKEAKWVREGDEFDLNDLLQQGTGKMNSK